MALDVKDFLLYQHYSGMIFLELKNYESALIAFNYCLFTPGSIASAIQVEAYKKSILTSLILKGRMSHLPSHMAISVQKVIESHSEMYLKFGEAFENCNYTKATGGIQASREKFDEDGNIDLIKDCCESVISKRILQLTKTYSTISLLEIERILGSTGLAFIAPLSVEGLIEKMIEEGMLQASICHLEKEIVTFHERPNTFDTTSTANSLQSEIEHLSLLNMEVDTLAKTIQPKTNFMQEYSME